MVLNCKDLKKSFSDKILFKNCSFHIEDNEKAAIVGINGAGKTTLLRMIIGNETYEEGMITLSKDSTIGYLAQNQSVKSNHSIYDELLSVKQNLIQLEERMRSLEIAMKTSSEVELEQLMRQYSNATHQFEIQNGYSYRSEVIGVLKGLGFDEVDFNREISTLSGGQKTRVALGKLLLQTPDLIILDEPTNHLDLSSIAWLETYLTNYKKAVLIVSHDRYFLDRTVTKIIEIDATTVTSFRGNYSDYAKKKEVLRTMELNAYLNQQKEIKHQEDVIEKLKSFNREKSIKRAESREKKLEKIELLEKPITVNAEMNLSLTPICLSGKDVLTIQDLSKSYDHITLFKHLSLECKRGEHIALIGDNGTGKTTLLKMVNGITKPDNGEILLGSNVYLGYYDQEHNVLNGNNTIFNEISDSYPQLTNTQIRNTLAAFLFTNDDVFKQIKDLSGGEKGRVSLAKLMLSDANFLILDEPTNHLDMISKEILENALNHYEGTVFYVSHDRYFINKTAHRILELSNQALTNYLGNYDYYLEKKIPSSISTAPAWKNTPAANEGDSDLSSLETDTKLDWKQQKEQQAKQRKMDNERNRLEALIETLEGQVEQLEQKMANPIICSNSVKLQEISNELIATQAKLLDAYEKWEEIS